MPDLSDRPPARASLALDICLGACVIGVSGADGETLFAVEEPMARGHQERLAPMVQAAMASAGVAFHELGRIGVTVGPGSFTGLRVGVAFARTMALSLDIACVGFSSLAALAASVPARGVTVAAIPSKLGQFFVETYADGVSVSAADQLDAASVAARLAEVWQGGPLTLVGPGAAALADLSPRAEVRALGWPGATALLALTRAALAPTAPPRPLYLRAPDARTIAERQALG